MVFTLLAVLVGLLRKYTQEPSPSPSGEQKGISIVPLPVRARLNLITRNRPLRSSRSSRLFLKESRDARSVIRPRISRGREEPLRDDAGDLTQIQKFGRSWWQHVLVRIHTACTCATRSSGRRECLDWL